MKKQLTLSLLFLLSITVSAQEHSPPHIDVTGTAEMEVVPDEIYIAITIRERTNGRGTVGVEQQEKDMKDAFRSIGLDLNNLEFSDAHADYIKVRWLTQKTVSQARYRLKCEDAYMVGKAFEQLDKLNIQDAYIAKVSHSNIKAFEKDIRIQAIKDAKDRADYLLTAIGERRGKALQVYENRNGNYGVRRENRMQQAKASINQIADLFSDEQEALQFQKIKLQSSVFVRFGIE